MRQVYLWGNELCTFLVHRKSEVCKKMLFSTKKTKKQKIITISEHTPPPAQTHIHTHIHTVRSTQKFNGFISEICVRSNLHALMFLSLSLCPLLLMIQLPLTSWDHNFDVCPLCVPSNTLQLYSDRWRVGQKVSSNLTFKVRWNVWIIRLCNQECIIYITACFTNKSSITTFFRHWWQYMF